MWFRKKREKKRSLTLPLCGISFLILVALLALYITQPTLLHQMDLKIYDHFLANQADGQVHPEIIIVDIDEPSLELYGQWPWPRYRMALLMGTLAEAGAAVVALDILLAEPDRTSPQLMQTAMKDELGLDMTFAGLPDTLLDNDKLLADLMSQIPVVLGCYFRFGEAGTFAAAPPTAGSLSLADAAPQLGTSEISTSSGTDWKPPSTSVIERGVADAIPAHTFLFKASNATLPLPLFVDAAKLGFFNMSMDTDGLVRRVPLLLAADTNIYASLAVETLMKALGTSQIRLGIGLDGLESLSLGKLQIPISADGTINVPFRGPSHTFPYMSAQTVLHPDFDPETVKGKIVFLGTSAPGLLDIRATPLDTYYPGVEVHASVVDALLSQRIVDTPAWTPGLQLLLILLMSALCLLAFAKVRPALAWLACGALAVAAFQISGGIYARGLYISPLWVIFTVGVQGLALVSFRYWWSERDKRMLRQAFNRYVAPEMVSRIVERGEVVLRGEERQLSVMFTDLRGFTSLSEGLTPEQVVSLLNRYFTPMTALVRNAHGTLDKFIGDAIMAFWNAPLDVPDHPAKAVHTALAMLSTLDTLNVSLKEDLDITLRMGAGIHCGPAYVGNMGSNDLTSYTAIGDTVNLASRLEGLCSRFGVRLVLSDDVVQLCGPVPLQRLVRLRVKGRQEPVQVYTAFTAEEALAFAPEMQEYQVALELYDQAVQARSVPAMEQCRAMFAALQEKFPSRFLYGEYVVNCTELCNTILEEWTDVWTLTSK